MRLVSHPSCLWARKLLNFSILSLGTLSGWHGFHKLPIPSLEGGGIAWGRREAWGQGCTGAERGGLQREGRKGRGVAPEFHAALRSNISSSHVSHPVRVPTHNISLELSFLTRHMLIQVTHEEANQTWGGEWFAKPPWPMPHVPHDSQKWVTRTLNNPLDKYFHRYKAREAPELNTKLSS